MEIESFGRLSRSSELGSRDTKTAPAAPSDVSATSRQRLPGPACRLQAPVRRGAAGRAAMSSLSGAHLAPYFAIVLLSSAADVAHIRPQFSSTRKKKDFLQGNKL